MAGATDGKYTPGMPHTPKLSGSPRWYLLKGRWYFDDVGVLLDGGLDRVVTGDISDMDGNAAC